MNNLTYYFLGHMSNPGIKRQHTVSLYLQPHKGMTINEY